jgi:hypothetical protein
MYSQPFRVPAGRAQIPARTNMGQGSSRLPAAAAAQRGVPAAFLGAAPLAGDADPAAAARDAAGARGAGAARVLLALGPWDLEVLRGDAAAVAAAVPLDDITVRDGAPAAARQKARACGRVCVCVTE